jgi:hypothetical protein
MSGLEGDSDWVIQNEEAHYGDQLCVFSFKFKFTFIYYWEMIIPNRYLNWHVLIICKNKLRL